MEAVSTVASSPKTLDFSTKNLVGNPEVSIPAATAFLSLKNVLYIYHPMRFKKS